MARIGHDVGMKAYDHIAKMLEKSADKDGIVSRDDAKELVSSLRKDGRGTEALAANNLFKTGLMAGHVDRRVLVRFGLPAVAATFVGAALLATLAGGEPLLRWSFLGRPAEVTAVKLVMGVLILVFALFATLEAGAERRAKKMVDDYLKGGGSDMETLLEMARTRKGRFPGSDKVIDVLEQMAGTGSRAA